MTHEKKPRKKKRPSKYDEKFHVDLSFDSLVKLVLKDGDEKMAKRRKKADGSEEKTDKE